MSKLDTFLFGNSFLANKIILWYIFIAPILAQVPGRKGSCMSNIEMQLLDLFRQLSTEEKEAVIDLAQKALSSEQEETASGPAS